ncbi:MAG: hypothetical protein ACI9TK_000458 [Flavobacteriaceae bacterium]|jgi:hypothetical protein
MNLYLKINTIVVIICFSFISCDLSKSKDEIYSKEYNLHHLLLFKFKEETAKDKIENIKIAGLSLNQIPGVYNLIWSTNISPEGFNKGLTHSLTMQFESEIDRDSVYLPHPIHVKFGEIFAPNLDDLVVYDYWSKK